MINILSPFILSCSAIALIFFGILVYIIYNLYRKNTIYENWTEEFFVKITKLQDDIKKIDDKNLFETDDEVGAVFDDLANIIKNFDHNIKSNKKEL